MVRPLIWVLSPLCGGHMTPHRGPHIPPVFPHGKHMCHQEESWACGWLRKGKEC